tara:strand:- start:1727 stop:2425 length:699 start_codon:yes stop_codon:yes gene_type:complete
LKKILICGYRDWAIQIMRGNLDSIAWRFAILKFDKEVDFKLVENKQSFKKCLKEYEPDLIFFIGWSWIISEDTINKYICICLHPSLLPKYRGGSPLQHQIINGEKESAVTFFKMDKFIDNGDIIYQEKFSLNGDLKDIFRRMVKLGIDGAEKIISNYLKTGIVKGKIQNKSKATYYKRRTPELSEIKIDDFKNYTAKELYNKIRALQDPYPNAYIKCKNGKKLYITRTSHEK